MNDREQHILLSGLLESVKVRLEEWQAIIAGGAIAAVFTGARIKDYDIYFRNEASFKAVKDWFDEQCISEPDGFGGQGKPNFYPALSTDTAITYKKDNIVIQLIKLYFNEDPISIISQFDFTACMGLYDFKTGTFEMGGEFLKHNSQRRLVVNRNCDYPIATMFRMVKYMNKGYHISGSEVVCLALKIQGLHITTYADLKKHLLGIDTLFLKDLTDSLDKPEYAEKQFDFNDFMQMIDEHLKKFYAFETESGDGI